MELTTDRLVLRYLSEADIDDITRICQDPEIYQHTLLIPSPYTRKNAENWLDIVNKSRAEDKAGDDFGIRLKENDRFIGVISLGAKNRHDDSEIGYWLDKDYRSQGIMTEALLAVIAFGFAKGCHRISACHFVGNPASGRVMAKAGMTKEGLHRESLKKNGQYLDDVVYGILDWEFKEIQEKAK
ncbi:MAG: GNAT family protein [Clostridiaceae bacterium]